MRENGNEIENAFTQVVDVTKAGDIANNPSTHPLPTQLLKGDQEDLLRVAVAVYKNASLLSRVGEIFGEAFLKAYNLHLN